MAPSNERPQVPCPQCDSAGPQDDRRIEVIANGLPLCISTFTLRWSALVFFAAACSFAASLLSLPLTGSANVDGELPASSDMLADSA